MKTESTGTLLRAAARALAEEKYEYAAQLTDRAIEQDVKNSYAWELRAAAAAGGATTADSRMEEAVNAWMTALQFVPGEEKEALQRAVVRDFTALFHKELRKRAARFSAAPDPERLEALTKTLRDGLRLQNLLTIRGGLSFDCGEQFTKTAHLLSDAAVSGFDSAAKAFGPSHSNMLRWQWEKYTDAGDGCLLLLEKAAVFCKDSDLGKSICDRYMQFGERLCLSNAWKYDEAADPDDPFTPDLAFTPAAKRIREEDIRRFRTIRGYFEANQTYRLCRELSAARADADALRAKEHYWTEHAGELRALEEESAALRATVKRSEALQDQLPVSAQLAQTRTQISQRETELKGLGFGARKKKKELQTLLVSLRETEKTQEEEEAKIKKALSWTCKKSRARIAEIKRLLAAPRGTLPAPAGSFVLNDRQGANSFCCTPQQLYDHLTAVLPAPFRAGGLLSAGRARVRPSADVSAFGPLWAGVLEKDQPDGTKADVEVQIFFAAKNRSAPLSAILLQSPAACTADEEALHDFGSIGALLLLSLLSAPDQPEAERRILELRHSDKTRAVSEGLRLEYLCTETELPDGGVQYYDNILIRPEPENAPDPTESEPKQKTNGAASPDAPDDASERKETP